MKQKKMLLPLIGTFFLLLQFEMKAQEYLPFPQDSAIWYSVELWQEDPPPPPVWYDTHKYEAKGDTNINNIEYTKLFSGWAVGEADHYEGAYRVDIEDECVYFIDNYYGTESLLYDFSLVPGDTITIQLDGMPEPFHLVCLDTSTMIVNNTPHHSYSIYSYLSNGTECYTTWVKGIGSLRMPLETDWFCAGLFVHYDLTCFFYKDEHIYEWEENPYFEGCIGTNVGIDEYAENNSFNIVPNPVIGTSRLISNIAGKTLFDYQIFDVTGNILLGATCVEAADISIQNNRYEKGIYVLRLYAHQFEQYYSIKFIIN